MFQIIIHTFRSLLREKIIFNVFGVSILFIFLGYLASLLVYGHQDRVMVDLGILINATSIFIVSISIGARFFRQEIESKTIYLFLTRPLSRLTFFSGRFLGMSLFLFLNFLILSFVLWIAIQLTMGKLSTAFFQSFVYTYLESIILLSVSILFGFLLRPALVFMLIIALMFLGHNHQLIRSLQSSMDVLVWITPDFSLLQMSDRVFYEEPLRWGPFNYGTLYGLIWLLFYFLIGNAIFSRKNL